MKQKTSEPYDCVNNTGIPDWFLIPYWHLLSIVKDDHNQNAITNDL